jgi:hypothetical protein
MEERLDHLCCLGGIEPGSIIAIPAAQRSLDGASGKRLGATFSHHRINTAPTGSHTNSGNPRAIRETATRDCRGAMDGGTDCRKPSFVADGQWLM